MKYSLLLLCIISCSCILEGARGGQITISGISSGGFMSVQYHVAFSSIVRGVAVIAGGPYYCAQGNLIDATTACMSDPDLIIVDELIAATLYAETTQSIDSTSNMATSRVWIYSGTKDTVVVPGVVMKLEEYYNHYVPSAQINTTYTIPSEHSFVTDNYGNQCDYLGPDYINNCGFNSANNLLGYLIGNLNPPSLNASASNILQIDQQSFIPDGTSALEAGLYEYAFAYIPQTCSDEKNKGLCSLHIAFHGCTQIVPEIGDTFYMNTGYNEVADTNNIIVLYPQANTNELNPKGCFDWWGFTGENYATQNGVQMATIKAMSDYLISEYITPN